MRSIFQIKAGYDIEDAKHEFADWIYKWSDSFDYQNAEFEDAVRMAEEFLKQENPRRIRLGL